MVATVILTSILIPDISVSSSAEDVEVLELGIGATPKGAVATGSRFRTSGASSVDDPRGTTVEEDRNGYAVQGRANGTVTLPLRVRLAQDDRAFVELWTYGGPSLETTAEVQASGGSRQLLGSPGQGTWQGKRFDVTDVAGDGRLVLRVSARNDGDASALFFDRVVLVREPSDIQASASPALVALWLGLIASTILQLFGRLRRHWPLPLLIAIAGFTFWTNVDYIGTFRPPAVWTLATQADWLDLQSGLLSGSFGSASGLTVQLFHALMPITGKGDAGAVAASAFIGVAAVAALYALGNRVAGRLAAVVTVLLALVVGSFREAATDGSSTTTLILAATLFAYALHASLAETNLPAVILLAAAGAVAVLADVLWLPGVIVCIPLCALLYGPRGERLRIAGLGLLILALILAPNRASVADQGGGSLVADLDARATQARNLENLLEEGAAPSQDTVGLGAFIFTDRSAGEVVGNAVVGAAQAIGSFASGGNFAILAALGFALSLLGVLYLLLVSRLRALALLPLLIALPEFFFAAEEVSDSFAAGAAVWPAFLAGGGLLVYVLFAAYGDRFLRPLRRSRWLSLRGHEAASDGATTGPQRRS